MKIAVFGTGSVGQALAIRLSGLSHSVTMGTRNVENALARDTKDFYGTPTVAEFANSNPSIALKTYADAANGADLSDFACVAVCNAVRFFQKLHNFSVFGQTAR
jgi:8-hydroxy-5-deazaflavin:NADPH oxidoreductase